MPDGSRYPDCSEFDEMFENWPQIALETGEVNWELINPDDIVAITAALAHRAMNLCPNPTDSATTEPVNIITEEQRLKLITDAFDWAMV